MEGVVAFWRALDDRFERVQRHSWGAVVTDARFPAIWDVNYARVERMEPGLSLERIREALDPALEAVAAQQRHLVLFEPEAMTAILIAASERGATLSWDAVLTLRGDGLRQPESVNADVEEVRVADEAFLGEVRSSLVEFDVNDERAAEQLMAIERAVLLPAGKRWFRIVAERRTAALGSLLRLGDRALVDHVVTLPFARRRGYAGAIVGAIARRAFDAGAVTVFLLTEPNGSARRVYERLGFAATRTIASTREPRPTAPEP